MMKARPCPFSRDAPWFSLRFPRRGEKVCAKFVMRSDKFDNCETSKNFRGKQKEKRQELGILDFSQSCLPPQTTRKTKRSWEDEREFSLSLSRSQEPDFWLSMCLFFWDSKRERRRIGRITFATHHLQMTWELPNIPCVQKKLSPLFASGTHCRSRGEIPLGPQSERYISFLSLCENIKVK